MNLLSVLLSLLFSKFFQTNIHEFARSGDFINVKRLIDEGVELNDRDLLGSTPIWWAAAAGHVEVKNTLETSVMRINLERL